MTTDTVQDQLTAAYAALEAANALQDTPILLLQLARETPDTQAAYLAAADRVAVALFTLGMHAENSLVTSFGLVATRFVKAMHSTLRDSLARARRLLADKPLEAHYDPLMLPMDDAYRALLAMTAALEHEDDRAA